MDGTLTRPQRGCLRGPVLAVTGWHRPAAVVVLAVLRTLPGLGLLAPG